MRPRKYFNLEDFYREQGDRMQHHKPKAPNRWITTENVLAVIVLILILGSSIVF